MVWGEFFGSMVTAPGALTCDPARAANFTPIFQGISIFGRERAFLCHRAAGGHPRRLGKKEAGFGVTHGFYRQSPPTRPLEQVSIDYESRLWAEPRLTSFLMEFGETPFFRAIRTRK